MKGLKWIFFSLILFIFFAFTTSMTNAFADEPEKPITIQVVARFSESDETNLNQIRANYADEITVNVDGYENIEFAYWILNNKIRNFPKDHKFIATENQTITALFAEEGYHVVVFINANGDVLKVDWVEDGKDATAPDTSELSLPGYVFDGWDKELTGITSNTIVVAQYEKVSEEEFELTVVNGKILGTDESTDTIGYNEVVTVVADDAPTGKVFSHWQVGHRVVSTQPIYKFTMLQDLRIEAVYAESAREDKPFVSIYEKVQLNGKPTYYGHFYIPENYTKVEYGFLYTNENVKLELNNEHVNKIQILNYYAETNEFILSFSELNPLFVGTYLVCKDSEGNIVTVYNEEVKDLFISEYGEGSSNNKWIEIYNPFHYEVDLSEYSVKLYANAATSPTNTVQLEGTLKPFSVIVIYHLESAQGIKDRAKYANISFAHAVANFNGDDVVCLYKNDVLIDVFGVMGEQNFWKVPNGNTKDHTIVRNPNIVAPRNVWDPNEWYAYDSDTFTYIGYHIITNEVPQQILIKGPEEVLVGRTINLYGIVYPIGTDQRVIWQSSNENIATVDARGVVQGISVGEVTITATSLEHPSVSASIVINVKTVSPTKVNVSGPNSVKQYKSIQLTATVEPDETVQSVLWESLNPEIATVDENGIVTGVSNGIAIIKVTSTIDSNIYATYEVEVIEATYYSIDIDYDSELGIIQHSPDDLSNILEDSSVEIIIEPIEGYIITQVTINGMSQTIDNPLQFRFNINSIKEDYSINITIEEAQEPIEQELYKTGFEASEGFSSSNIYNNTDIEYRGPSSQQWGFYYGTPSTTEPITGKQSAQMRWYKSAKDNKGYTFTNFAINKVTKVVFKAKNTNGINVIVSYSYDKENWIGHQLFTLSTSASEYTYIISPDGTDNPVYIKFELTYSTEPSDTSRLYIDDVRIYGFR